MEVIMNRRIGKTKCKSDSQLVYVYYVSVRLNVRSVILVSMSHFTGDALEFCRLLLLSV